MPVGDAPLEGQVSRARWQLEPDGGLATVRLAGELDLAVVEGGFLTDLDEWLDGHPIVCCDLHDVTFIDSTGLRMLLRLKQDVEKRGGSFLLARPSDPVKRVLDVAGATRVFDFLDAGLAVCPACGRDTDFGAHHVCRECGARL